MKNRRDRVTAAAIGGMLLLGLALLLYPPLSSWWNAARQAQSILDYSDSVARLKAEEQQRLRGAAEEFNRALLDRVSPYALPEGFVLLADAVPDILQEIRYYSTYNFVGSRIDGYEQPCAILTAEAAQALRAVSDDLLAQGCRLKVYDAYRPQSAVDHFVRWAEDLEDTAMQPCFYPEEEKSRLFARGYIAARSGHSRGSTVDLTLLDEASGKELDMGGTFDYFGAPSHTDYDGLTPEQRANRALLRDAMLRHGFRGIKTEWWHFTLQEEPFPDTYFDFPVRAPD